jgi:hypothetical protein
MRNPITDINFKATAVGDYQVRVDFSFAGRLRRGTIGETWHVGNQANRRWVAVRADGTELDDLFLTRFAAAEALLESAKIITVNGTARFLFDGDSLKEIN